MKNLIKKIRTFFLDLIMVLSPFVVASIVAKFLSKYQPADVSILMAIAIAFMMWICIAALLARMKRGWRYTFGMMLLVYVANGLYTLLMQYNFNVMIFTLIVLFVSLVALAIGWKDVKDWSYQN